MNTKEDLVKIISDFISLAAKRLPDDVISALERLRSEENGETASELYKCIFQNLDLAEKMNRPICQDTGVLQFFIKAGTKFPWIDDMEEIINKAVLKATNEAPLRHNVVETFTEINTGTNTGTKAPWIEWEIVPNSDELYFDVYFAGGGCSLPGRSKVLMPSEGYEGIVKFVFDTVVDWGVNACPPLLVGVGIGTCSPTAALLSKKALLRPAGSVNENDNARKLEAYIKEGLDNLGIGPLGMTGNKSVMGVNMEFAAHHPATLAVGISVGCWATRRGSVTIKSNMEYEIHSHSSK